MSWASIQELAKSVQSGENKAAQLVEKSLRQIDETKDYNALISVVETAKDRAQEIDDRIAKGEDVGPLAGVPFIAKDNFLTKGTETTAASNILKGFNPPYTSTAVKRLEEAGAILVAKANLDSFAHGSSTENSDFGPSKNPHDETRVPGGSSGGSATAVSLGLVPFSIGTDTGGSIRQPASFTGVVGYKPTYGLVSRYGVVAMASSTDVIGPITSSVEDTALVLEIMSGRDKRDATTIERDSAKYTEFDGSLQGKKVGVIEEHMGDGVDEDVKKVVDEAISQLESAGAEVKRISVPSKKLALAVYYIIMPAEVSSNLSRYDGVRFAKRSDKGESLEEVYDFTRGDGFNKEVKRRILIGTYVLNSGYYDAYYKKAQTVRTKLINEYNEAAEGLDFIVGPTAPTIAFKLGENTHDPLAMYMSDILTVGANLVGSPAISIPAGEVDGMPVGMQLMSTQGDDRNLLSYAHEVERLIGGQA